MKEYSGAVLFIDLLGFGYLTGTPKSVSIDDFKAHRFSEKSVSNQMFSAYILAEFRKHLIILRDNSNNIKVAQLSDCAFAWSEDPDLILEFSRKIMWSLAMDGILCRAGIAYGQILQPIVTAKSIGDYICGSAVTNAVENEKAGKGARIFVDSDFPTKCSPHAQYYFKPRISNVDYKIADEFCWYLCPNDIASTSSSKTANDRSERSRSIIELVGMYIYSPKFRWNSETTLGLHQIASTVDIISISYNELKIGPVLPNKYEHIMVAKNTRSRGKYNSYITSMCSHL